MDTADREDVRLVPEGDGTPMLVLVYLNNQASLLPDRVERQSSCVARLRTHIAERPRVQLLTIGFFAEQFASQADDVVTDRAQRGA